MQLCVHLLRARRETTHAGEAGVNRARTPQAGELFERCGGHDKVRVTGGEPLITPKFDEFLMGLGALGFEDVSLTTNAQKLSEKIDVIEAAGIND